LRLVINRPKLSNHLLEFFNPIFIEIILKLHLVKHLFSRSLGENIELILQLLKYVLILDKFLFIIEFSLL